MTITTFSRYVLWVNLVLAVLLLSQLGYSAESSSSDTTPSLFGYANWQQAFAVVEDFLSRFSILDYDYDYDYDYAAAGHYGDIRATLERKGTPIGVNDLHIAGHACSTGLILVSNNLSEFERVDGLRLDNRV